jgi:hypothetical protein
MAIGGSSGQGRVKQQVAVSASGKSGVASVMRHGKPAGILIGFGSEEDWFDYRLEHHPAFLRRVAAARDALRSGGGVRLEELPP